jgi:aminopeptidase N
LVREVVVRVARCLTTRVVIAAAVLAACTSPGVRSESAQRTPSSPPSPPTTAPSSTDPPIPAPPTSVDPGTTTTPATTDASTSAGDELYPELGSADLDVAHYDVQLDYDPASNELSGTVSIDVAVDRRTPQLAFDAVGLTVESVTVDGEPAEFDTTASELLVTPDIPVGPSRTGRPTNVEIAYRDQPGPADTTASLPVGWFTTRRGAYVLNEPDGARSWLPSNDHPSDKATWRFAITVPAGTTAVANGTLVGERLDTDDSTWVWRQDDPMATYLVQLLVGDYRVLDGGRAAGVPIVNVALAADVERMQPYFDLTPPQMEFFERILGPYPLDGYGLAMSDSVPGLAMETQGRSLFSRSDFQGGEPGYIEHLLLAHELAHQWFGNAVTPAAWRDIWLNESFASYAQWLWLEEAGLEDLEVVAQSNLEARQQPTRPTSEPTAETLFDYESYDGGAVVLHALRKVVGDDAFFEILRRWVADNNGQSRTTDDFVALAEQVAGRSLDEWQAEWLDAAALPAQFPG